MATKRPNGRTTVRDDIGMPGAGSPGFSLSPELQSLLQTTEAMVTDYHDELTNAADDVIRELASEVDANERQLGVLASTPIGSLDSDVREHEQAADRILSKTYQTFLSDILAVENDLTTVGVHIPVSTFEIANVVANDDPNEMLGLLMGLPPMVAYTADAGKIGGVDGTSPPPPAPDGGGTPPPPVGPIGGSGVEGPRLCPTDDDPEALCPAGDEPPPPPPPSPDDGEGDCSTWDGVEVKPCGPGQVMVKLCNPDGTFRLECQPAPAPAPGPVPAPGPGEPPTPPGSPEEPCGCHGPAPEPPEGDGEPSLPPPPAPEPEPPPGPPPGDVCPVPVAPAGCPPDAHPAPLACFVWCGEDPLGDARARLVATEYAETETRGAPLTLTPDERERMGPAYTDVIAPLRTLVGEVAWLTRGHTEEVRAEAEREVGKWVGGSATAASLMNTLISGPFAECLKDMPAVMRLGQQVAVASTVESKTGFPASYLVQQSMYLYQYANPQYIPSQAEVDAEYLTGRLTEQQWEGLTRANGNIPDCFRKQRDAKENKPGPSDIIRLFLRDKLSGDDAKKRLREVGVLEDRYKDELLELAKFIPPYTDLVSFMVRDVFDPKVVKDYDLDKDFDKKFSDKTLAWASAQGIDKEVFRYIWRAHWKIPSNTQLYEMVNRLRPDRPEVKRWEQLYLDPDTGEPFPLSPPKPTVVYTQDIKDALLINDNAPTWVNALMAINTHPINRTDAIDAYHAGAFTEEDLYEALRDNSYDEINAQRVVDIQKVKRGRRLANLTGVWTFRKIVKAYQDGTIDGVRADQLLTPLLTDPQQRQDVLSSANEEVQANVRKQGIVKARRGYFVGEWDREQTRKSLLDLKVEPARVEQLIQKWEFERTGRFREPTVRLLVQWYVVGAISQDELFRRCSNLGFNNDDCRRIVIQANDSSTRDQQRKFRAVVGDYEHAAKNMAQAAKLDDGKLLGRREALLRDQKKIVDELARIEKVMADRVGP